MSAAPATAAEGHAMLTDPTVDLLIALGLTGMAQDSRDLEAHPEAKKLDHAEWLAVLL